MVKFAEFEYLSRLPLDNILVIVMKGQAGVSLAETGRHRRKCQQLFGDLLAKMQAWKESILTDAASRLIDIHILKKRRPGGW